MLCLSCLRPDREGQLPAVCPFLVIRPHTGKFRFFVPHEEAGIVHSAHGFIFARELSGGEGRVPAVEGKLRSCALGGVKQGAL
jgi:hypothetical protein